MRRFTGNWFDTPAAVPLRRRGTNATVDEPPTPPVPPPLGARDENLDVPVDPLRAALLAAREFGDEHRGIGRWTRLSG